MIEKMIESAEAQARELLKTKGIVRAYRNRLEIELGGLMARRDAEHAENLRVQINDCFATEKFLGERLEEFAGLQAALKSQHAPEIFPDLQPMFKGH